MMHLQNAYAEEELLPQATHKKFLSVHREGAAVIKNFFTTAADRKNYSTKFCNLDAIGSGGTFSGRNAPTMASRLSPHWGRQLEWEFGRGFSEKSLRHVIRVADPATLVSTRKMRGTR